MCVQKGKILARLLRLPRSQEWSVLINIKSGKKTIFVFLDAVFCSFSVADSSDKSGTHQYRNQIVHKWSRILEEHNGEKQVNRQVDCVVVEN